VDGTAKEEVATGERRMTVVEDESEFVKLARILIERDRAVLEQIGRL
jgi:hypothetical protein